MWWFSDGPIAFLGCGVALGRLIYVLRLVDEVRDVEFVCIPNC
jgi:hypothetical protein